jgi:hypothetical protein
MMHPEMARSLAQDRCGELVNQAHERARARDAREMARARRSHGRRPKWHVTWSREVLAAAGAGAGQTGRSWVIIISATRGA